LRLRYVECYVIPSASEESPVSGHSEGIPHFVRDDRLCDMS
jgi:hypothetical protein